MTEMQKLLEAFAKVAAKQGKSGKRGKKVKANDADKATAAAANEAKVIETFTALGYKDVRPRITVKTASGPSGWLKEGRVPAKGQKAVYIKSGGYPLFHIDQTVEVGATNVVPMTTAEVQPVVH